MSRVFIAKMDDPAQAAKKEYRAPDKKVFGGIEAGDFVFIKLKQDKKDGLASIKRLWTLKEIKSINDGEYKYAAEFEEICQFDPITLQKFQALDLFVLDVNLLIKCFRQFKGINFYELTLVDSKKSNFIEIVESPEKLNGYISDETHFRKIVKVDSKDSVQQGSINVQLYREGDSWRLYETEFIGSDLREKFDSTQYDLYDKYGRKDKNTDKNKMYSYLSGLNADAPMMGLWDLFCGNVDENVDTEKPKKTSDKKNDETSATEDEASTDTYTTYDYSLAKHCGVNKVFYGTPGCGKSYYLENKVLVQEGINAVYRTSFFQDYSNTDFVGQILPKIDEKDMVTYEFMPGPFTLALKRAIDNPEEKVALIIEELNRGNAPSIFGDIFQLLDRKEGESRYEIVNINILNYLQKDKPRYDLDYIKLPKNLYIYATMNTSDQNVFTLDTAFKRRWSFEKLKNEFSEEDEIGSKLVPGLKEISWKVFVQTVNDFIISHAMSLSAEDKQLGKYFVEPDLLMDSSEDYSEEKLKEFSYKVFEYLWSDVAKFNRKDWFIDPVKSLDDLIDKYLKHENIFVPELAAKLPVYVPSEEE